MPGSPGPVAHEATGLLAKGERIDASKWTVSGFFEDFWLAMKYIATAPNPSSAQRPAGETVHEHRWVVLGVLSTAFFLDSASTAALAASFRALEVQIGLSPMRQGFVLMLQSLTGSAFAPVWGVLADRHDRTATLAAAAAIWAGATLYTTCVQTLWQLGVARLLFGIGTSGLTPVVQSVVADMFMDCERGRAFSICIAASGLGTLCAIAVVTAISQVEFVLSAGPTVDGWQLSFGVLGCLASIFAVGIFCCADKLAIPRQQGGAATSPWRDFWETLRTPSFRVVLIQGAFVSTAIEAHAFLVIWVQYIGYTNLQAGLLVAVKMLGILLGCFAGGFLADKCSRYSPDHGRVYVGQLGGCLMLVFWSCLMALPRSTDYVIALVVVLFCFGFVRNWEYVGAIRPILVEIAPSRRRASAIGYAACIDGIVAACMGGPLIGFLAEGVFGYEMSRMDIDAMSESRRESNLNALTQALAFVTVVCISLNLAAFGILHLTYKVDRRAAADYDGRSA